MERRGFLKGLFGGVTSAGLLIAAKPSDIEAFAAPLVKQEPLIIDSPPKQALGAGEHLYNSRGELVAIITHLSVDAPTIEATGWGDDTYKRYYSGMREIRIEAIGVGSVDLGTFDPRRGPLPELRGKRR